MDVKDTGMTVLLLRVRATGSRGKRVIADKVMEQWIAQVKLSERAAIDQGLIADPVRRH